jgi:hypothetical protein
VTTAQRAPVSSSLISIKAPFFEYCSVPSKSVKISGFQVAEYDETHAHLDLIASHCLTPDFLHCINLTTPQFTQHPGPSILTHASADPITLHSFPITHVSHVLTIHTPIKRPSTPTIFLLYHHGGMLRVLSSGSRGPTCMHLAVKGLRGCRWYKRDV